LEEIIFEIFKNSGNSIINVELAKVLGYLSQSKSFRNSRANFLQASGIVIATALYCHMQRLYWHISALCIIATSYEDNVNFLDYWNVGLFSQEMFAIFHQLNIIFI
jgi:hypothetical protein